MASTSTSRPESSAVVVPSDAVPRHRGGLRSRARGGRPRRAAFSTFAVSMRSAFAVLLVVSVTTFVVSVALSSSWAALEQQEASARRLDSASSPSSASHSGGGLLAPPPPALVKNRRKRPNQPRFLHNGTASAVASPYVLPPPLAPAFRCHRTAWSRPSKVVFVHVFKTAGSHLRHFFVEYSRLCHAGFGLAVHCPWEGQYDLALPAGMGLNQTLAANGTTDDDSVSGVLGGDDSDDNDDANVRDILRRCSMKWAVPRRGDGRPEGKMPVKQYNRKLNVSHVRNNVDVLAGHFRIGAGEAIWGAEVDEHDGGVGKGRPLTNGKRRGGNGGGQAAKAAEGRRRTDWKNATRGGVPHLTMGGHKNRQRRRRRRVRYVTFIRNALDKFVSGLQFNNKVTLQKGRGEHFDAIPRLVRLVREHVRSGLAYGEYDHSPGYGNYLRTVRQTVRQPTGHDTYEERALQVMTNLVRFDVTVGVTERMSDSLQLVSGLMDPDGSAGDLFERYGMSAVSNATTAGGRDQRAAVLAGRRRLLEGTEGHGGSEAGDDNRNDLNHGGDNTDQDVDQAEGKVDATSGDEGVLNSVDESETGEGETSGATHVESEEKINESTVPTAELINALREGDGKLFAQVLDFVRYEQQMTDFALALHLQQYRGTYPQPPSQER